MTIWPQLRERMRALLFRAREEREMATELQFHIEMETARKRRTGMNPQEARRQAMLAFGGVERYKEEVRDARGTRWLEDARADVRYAARTLRRNPGYTSVVILTLALGIGATTSIFSVVRGVLLRPLPFGKPAQLVRLHTVVDDEGPIRTNLSPANFMSLREETRAFTDIAAIQTGDRTLTGMGAAQTVATFEVSAGFFEMLGVQPVLGRTFREAENEPGNDRVAILGYGAWQQRFGRDPSIVGRTITLDGNPVVVVGVMPADFSFPDGRALWVPISYDGYWSAATANGRKGNTIVTVVGRLQPDVTLEAARAELRTLGRRLAARFPATNTGVSFTAEDLRRNVVGAVRTPLLLLFGSVTLVLLIACTNVVGLLLARAAARHEELAARAALGASRGRLVRQLLAESVLLGVVGGALGLLVAVLGTEALLAVQPGDIPRLDGVRVDGSVLAFAMGLTLLAGIVVGLVPALQATRRALAPSLRGSGRGRLGGRSGTRVRSALVVSEIALAVVLLAGAGLLMRSFLALTAVDPGFRTERVLAFTLEPADGASVYDAGEKIHLFYTRLLERIAGLPSVQSAGAVSRLPIARGPFGSGFRLEGEPPPRPGELGRSISVLSVTPDYVRTMAIPVLRGRGITTEDRAGTSPVVLIDQAAAERLFPGMDPVGKRLVQFSYDPIERTADAFTIVGVVGDVRNQGLDIAPSPTAYFAHAQVPLGRMSVVVQTTGNPLALTRSIRAEVQALDPNVPVPQFTTLEQVTGDSVARPRFVATLLALFAAVALALAAIGIFGLLSFAVAQQTREIGVRIALGARPGEVVRRVVGRALRLAAIGLGLGLLAALALTRLLGSMLFGVSATDPVTYVGATALLGVTVLVAALVPARRAATVDPMVALRAE